MYAGERAKIKAPAHYGYGAAFKAGDFEGFGIPGGSDLIFEIDILDCYSEKDEDDLKCSTEMGHYLDSTWGKWEDEKYDTPPKNVLPPAPPAVSENELDDTEKNIDA